MPAFDLSQTLEYFCEMSRPLLFQLSRHFDVTGRSVGLDGVSQSKELIERANPSSWFFFQRGHNGLLRWGKR
jgi:hypothetical protein